MKEKILNRAQTLEQKREIVDRLLNIWLQQPTLRLGAILSNCVPLRQQLYYVEDYELVELLEAYQDRVKAR